MDPSLQVAQHLYIAKVIWGWLTFHPFKDLVMRVRCDKDSNSHLGNSNMQGTQSIIYQG